MEILNFEAYWNNFIKYADIQNRSDETRANSLDHMKAINMQRNAIYPVREYVVNN